MRWPVLCLLPLLAGCAGFVTAPAVPRTHDLGPLPSAYAQVRPLASVTLSAPSWLAGTAMQYREAAAPTVRASYAHNRWAAPPAALVEHRLERLLATGGARGCRLHGALTEFIFVFDAQGSGQARLTLDVQVLGAQGVRTERSLDVVQEFGRGGPAEGAMAMRGAVERLGAELTAWLARPDGAACQSG